MATVRALQVVATLLTPPPSSPFDRVMNAISVLEVARNVRTHANQLVMLLTERALAHGASVTALGFGFLDP